MSTDTELTSAGYNQSFAMIDFGAVSVIELYILIVKIAPFKLKH